LIINFFSKSDSHTRIHENTESDNENNNRNIIDEERRKRQEDEKGIFDVAIIGAGFAGLSSALLLGRYLRSTVIFDGGKPRNYSSKHLHGYLGFENSSPNRVMQKAWNDILQYNSIKVIREKVVKAENNSGLFFLSTESANNLIRSKYLIIATGVEDSKPKIKNFEMFDGNGAWHCPHCDGFETINKKLGIITYGKNAIAYTKEFLGWTRDITVFIQGSFHLSDKELNEAKVLGINVIDNEDIMEIRNNESGNMRKIMFKSGSSLDVDVIFYHLGYKVQNQIAKQLGCQLDAEEGFVKVNSLQQTTVRNVYAIGDVDTDRHYVVLAAASGAVAAISIYEETLKDAIREDNGIHTS